MVNGGIQMSKGGSLVADFFVHCSVCGGDFQLLKSTDASRANNREEPDRRRVQNLSS